MTQSNVVALRPPDDPPLGYEWKPYPGARYYEFSHRGKARSVDRTLGGKFYPGRELATRPNNQGYLLVDIRMDNGTKKTVTMHSGVLRAHAGEPGPDEETLHGLGGQLDNRYPENIRWGTRPQNLADMAANRPPPKPKPLKVCPRCQCEHDGPGRRCHECVVILGQAGAALLEEGADLEEAAKMLDYPSAVGLFRLAVKYGGLRFRVDDAAYIPHRGDPPSPRRWLRRVKARWEAWSADSDRE